MATAQARCPVCTDARSNQGSWATVRVVFRTAAEGRDAAPGGERRHRQTDRRRIRPQDLKEVERYTKAADQKKLARAAMDKLPNRK